MGQLSSYRENLQHYYLIFNKKDRLFKKRLKLIPPSISLPAPKCHHFTPALAFSFSSMSKPPTVPLPPPSIIPYQPTTINPLLLYTFPPSFSFFFSI
ncbi:hypothetical protein HN51_000815 [Arachis hypogaea]